MRDLIFPEIGPSDPDPVRRAQKAMAGPPLPKRFYGEANVERRVEGWAILLDGRPARTPARKPLALSNAAAAEIVAAEWRAQERVVDPAQMPATRIANAAIDHVAERMAEVRDDVARYAASDLVCYRAEGPAGLVSRQRAQWDPVVAWAEEMFGHRLTLAEGVIHQPQPAQTLAAARAMLDRETEPVRLAALHVATTLTGSCFLALMLAGGGLASDAAWAAGMVDEEWNADAWGRDAEAEARAAGRRAEFMAAAALLAALR